MRFFGTFFRLILLLCLHALLLPGAAWANAFFVTSVESTAEAIRIEARMTIDGASHIDLHRVRKEDIRSDESHRWATRQDPMVPMDNDGDFFFVDRSVELGQQYCYRLELIFGPGRLPLMTPTYCAFFDQDAQVERPEEVTDVAVIEASSTFLKVRFRDQSENEKYFFLEVEEPRFNGHPDPDPAWRIVAIAQGTPGKGTMLALDAISLEMERRYCFRIRAINTSGSTISRVTCLNTTPIELTAFKTLDQPALHPMRFTHPATGSLEVEWFDAFREHDARVVTLREIDDLDRVVDFRLVGVPSSTPVPSTQRVRFDDLDPDKEYCVNVRHAIMPFDPRFSICESPFGPRSQPADISPAVANIGRIVGSSGKLRLDLSTTFQGQLLDVTLMENGQRQTVTTVRDGRDSIELSLRPNKEYCFRMFRTNTFGTSYSRSICAIVPNVPTVPPSGETGGQNGEVVHPYLQAGIDCDCPETGAYVDLIAPDSSLMSADGKYRVEKSANFVSVFRNSDNVRVFNAPNLNNGFKSGFGPNSRYFYLENATGLNSFSIGVHDLEETGPNDRPFFDASVAGQIGIGFSPDGRTFMLSRNSNLAAFTVSLTNLLTHKSELLSFASASSGDYQFSPCGDRFMVLYQQTATSLPQLNLYATSDFEALVQGFTLDPGFTAIAATSDQHVTELMNGAEQEIIENFAGGSCQIPVREGGIYDLQVARLPTVSISTSAADQLFGDATDLLQTSATTTDVACDVTLNRTGAILSHTFGEGTIDTADEMNQAMALPGQVKIASRINFCGGLRDALGCAEQPGRNMVMTLAMDEDVTLAHEFGHNRGLQHSGTPTSLMFGEGGTQAVEINQQDCDVFLGVSSASFATDGPVASQNAGDLEVAEFVRRSFFHGVPFDRARAFGADSVPKLARMLTSESEKRYWRNIVVVLAMLGSDDAIEPLIAFIENDISIADDDVYLVKTNAVRALGYIHNATGNRQVLSYLQDSLSPTIWNRRGLVGLSEQHENVSARNLDFSKYAIFGLALSGTEAAERALINLVTPVDHMERNTMIKLALSDEIQTALGENRKIQALGLSRYYAAEDR